MKKVTLLIVLMSCSGVLASDDITIGNPAYGGNGCPQGSAHIQLSSDRKSFMILFDQYKSSAGELVGKTMDRVSCNLAFPIHVPAGQSVSIRQIQYQGYYHLTEGTKAEFRSEYFFAGSSGKLFRHEVHGPATQDFTIADSPVQDPEGWSACGQSVNFRINSNLMTFARGNGKLAEIQIDLVKFKNGIQYFLDVRHCKR